MSCLNEIALSSYSCVSHPCSERDVGECDDDDEPTETGGEGGESGVSVTVG